MSDHITAIGRAVQKAFSQQLDSEDTSRHMKGMIDSGVQPTHLAIKPSANIRPSSATFGQSTSNLLHSNVHTSILSPWRLVVQDLMVAAGYGGTRIECMVSFVSSALNALSQAL